MSSSASEYSEGIMEAQAKFQHIETLSDFTMVESYRSIIHMEEVRDSERRTALAKEIPISPDKEGTDRLENTTIRRADHDRWAIKHSRAERMQTQKEFDAYENKVQSNITTPTPLQTGNMHGSDLDAIRDILSMVKQGKDELTQQEIMLKADQALPALQRLLDQNPDVQSHALVGGFQEYMQLLPGMFASVSEVDRRHLAESSKSKAARCSAGDWARYVVKTTGLGPETLLGLVRGLSRPVDARDPSDWMSLFWEVAVSAPCSSIMLHNLDTDVKELISELDRASEILALSYRHRVHSDQTDLRYRLQECCWADLRQVVEDVVEARPHGRIIPWWDQILGASTTTAIPWANVGLLPYVVFRVVHNPPTRCEKYNPVYRGRGDKENPADNGDLRRLWIHLEHRLAKRGRGLLTSRRMHADGCTLWSLERVAPAWDGQLYREIRGEDCVPLLGTRKLVSHLLREEVGDRVVTLPQGVEKLQQWAATLAILPRRDWSLFLAGKKILDSQKLTVPEVILMVLRAGAPTTSDGDGPLTASTPTVKCPRISENRRWSGMSEWAPLLFAKALKGWMQPEIEREARQELGKFTVWIVFPIETDNQGSEAVAIGKLWTPVQPVSSYMLIWLELPTGFESWRTQKLAPDGFSTSFSFYANGQVRMTQLVWPSEVMRSTEHSMASTGRCSL